MNDCLVCSEPTKFVLCKQCFINQGRMYTTDQKAISIERWFNNIIDQCILGNCPAEIGVMDMRDILEIIEKYTKQQQEIETLKSEKVAYVNEWDILKLENERLKKATERLWQRR